MQLAAVNIMSLATSVGAAYSVWDVACPRHQGSTEPCTMKHCPMHSTSETTHGPSHPPSDVDVCFLSCPSDETFVDDRGRVGLFVGMPNTLATPELVTDATHLSSVTMPDPVWPVPSPPPRD